MTGEPHSVTRKKKSASDEVMSQYVSDRLTTLNGDRKAKKTEEKK